MRKKLSEEERKARKKARTKKWRENNLEKVRVYERKNNEKRVDSSREYHASYYKERALQVKKASLKRNYNLTIEDVKNITLQQDSVCGICKIPSSSLVVDHNHSYNKVRGLLCNQCNLGLGLFRDNPSYLKSASDYLLERTPMKGNVLITGVTGQIGSYLADLCLSKGHEVYGLVRRTSSGSLGHCPSGVKILNGDLTDQGSIIRAIAQSKPVYLFNMGAQSHVGHSFNDPVNTFNTTAIGPLNCLEAIRQSGLHVRFLQASTSEMFGGISDKPANESTSFYPKSPYGCSKLAAHWLTINYRESYNFFACAAIMFNNESPRRGSDFVTRKITKGIAAIKAGKTDTLLLGNLDAKRDWSFTGDFANGLYMMLVESSQPQELVFSSGETRSIREFCDEAFTYAGLGDYNKYVKVDPKFFRPAEVNILVGDSAKARSLGWKPQISFTDLVHMMVDKDLSDLTL